MHTRGMGSPSGWSDALYNNSELMAMESEQNQTLCCDHGNSKFPSLLG